MNVGQSTSAAQSPESSASQPVDLTNIDQETAERSGAVLADLLTEIGTAVRGKPEAIETAVLCVLAEGHLLLDDVPGVGKTLLAKSVAATIGGVSSRVQFTPDLLPGDITGISIWQPTKESFAFRPGPIFANLVLCDELNRGPAKTQSALLEAMEERSVTVDGTTYVLARPFMVIATQNPFEQDGTYNLPESQIDRFLMRTAIGYPDRQAELDMLSGGGAERVVPSLRCVLKPDEVASLVALTSRVFAAPALLAYVADLCRATREHADVALGVSPRGALSLARASRAHALLRGRSYATPDDVRAVAHRVLDHRILVQGTSRWNRREAARVIDSVLGTVAIPTARPAGSHLST